jgi:hypothetical protein
MFELNIEHNLCSNKSLQQVMTLALILRNSKFLVLMFDIQNSLSSAEALAKEDHSTFCPSLSAFGLDSRDSGLACSLSLDD